MNSFLNYFDLKKNYSARGLILFRLHWIFLLFISNIIALYICRNYFSLSDTRKVHSKNIVSFGGLFFTILHLILNIEII